MKMLAVYRFWMFLEQDTGTLNCYKLRESCYKSDVWLMSAGFSLTSQVKG